MFQNWPLGYKKVQQGIVTSFTKTRGFAKPAAGPVHPDGNVCFRGGGFEDKHQGFFKKGKKFRQPAYLATSFSKETTELFIRRSGMKSKVRWTVRIDPGQKCR